MHCFIFKSTKKEDTYLYVCQNLDCLPPPLIKALAPFEHVMELTLHPQRKLASSDVKKVLQALLIQGFYLQLPQEAITNIQRFNEPLYDQ